MRVDAVKLAKPQAPQVYEGLFHGEALQYRGYKQTSLNLKFKWLYQIKDVASSCHSHKNMLPTRCHDVEKYCRISLQ